MLTFELWDSLSSNLLAAFDSQAEAIDFIVRWLRTCGEAVIEPVELLSVDEDGEGSRVLANGQALADLAKSTA